MCKNRFLDFSQGLHPDYMCVMWSSSARTNAANMKKDKQTRKSSLQHPQSFRTIHTAQSPVHKYNPSVCVHACMCVCVSASVCMWECKTCRAETTTTLTLRSSHIEETLMFVGDMPFLIIHAVKDRSEAFSLYLPLYLTLYSLPPPFLSLNLSHSLSVSVCLSLPHPGTGTWKLEHDQLFCETVTFTVVVISCFMPKVR